MFSIFNYESFEMIKPFNLKRIKVASRTVKDNFNLVKDLVKYGKPTIISLGMWEKKEPPIKNKKKTLETAIEEMRNFAFAYIEKYTPSKQQLKIYLLKKYLKSSNPSVKKKDITDLIDLVTEDLEKTKFISDKFYSDSKAKNLIQRGSSINKIRNYLISKGIKDKYIKETISKIKEKNEDQDFFSAIKICKKKRIGPARDQDNRSLFYKKDISILARSGFDFETSKKVLEIVKDDYLRIINLL